MTDSELIWLVSLSFRSADHFCRLDTNVGVVKIQLR
jgi:hypothetical protein